MSEENTSEITETINEVSLEAESASTKTENMKAKTPTWAMVKDLRLEAAQNRVAAADLEKKLAQAEKDFETRLADRESQVRTEAQNEARTERAMARLESLATKDGLLDPDLVSMIDTSGIEYDDAGKIKNAQELIDAFKASKPHLFAAQATSSAAKTPKATSETKSVKDMTEAEYIAYKRSKNLSL